MRLASVGRAEPAATPGVVAAALAYAHRHRERFVAELGEFVRFASVSADPRRATDIAACATWLAGHVRGLGLSESAVVPTPRHPLVRAASRGAPGQPTALIYGHYDVVPPDPLDAWRSPPFVATRRGDELYGRGTSDDKGQLFAHVKALEAYLRTAGRLPINVTGLFDGEEEIGSPSLDSVLASHYGAFRADVAVVSDTPMLAPGRPAITYALRGLLSLDLQVDGPRRDLHSGTFGGAVHNPAQVLCDMLSTLHDAAGRVAVPGFYDRVRSANDAERGMMARTGPSATRFRHDAGIELDWGERGYTLYERTTLRPALIVNGVAGGYRGPGPKGVIPARAQAKLSVRLVPDQDPGEIAECLERHLARIAPPTVRLTVARHVGAPPFVMDGEHPALPAAVAACRAGFGTTPVLLRAGGTIPAVSVLETVLGLPPLLMGFGLPADGIHGPNERLHLPTFWRGVDTCIWLMAELGHRVEPEP